MGVSNEFPRDPVRRSSTKDHCACDESEHCGPGSFHPTLTASGIQDRAFFVYATDGSRPPYSGQHHSAPHGPSHGRGPTQDNFDSSPTNYGSTHYVQQHNHEWSSLAESLDPTHTTRPAEWNPPHCFVVCGDETYDRLETGGLRSSIGVSPPPTNVESSLQLQDVHAYDAFTSYPNGPSFPWDDGPLIQPPYDAARAVSTIGQAHPNQTQLSSGSQGPSLIPSEIYDSMAQHLTSRSRQWDGDSSFPPERWITPVPQRRYGRKRDNKIQDSIDFKVNGRSGITVQDAIRKTYAGLEGRDNQVLVDKSSVITLRLEWPSYPSWSHKIRLNDWKKKPQRIKLERLTTEVAKSIKQFIKVKGMQAVEHPDRVYPDWRVGPGLIGIDRLVLISLDRVSRGSWQPRIGFLSPDEINHDSTPFV